MKKNFNIKTKEEYKNKKYENRKVLCLLIFAIKRNKIVKMNKRMMNNFLSMLCGQIELALCLNEICTSSGQGHIISMGKKHSIDAYLISIIDEGLQAFQ